MDKLKSISAGDIEANQEAYQLALTSYILSRGDLSQVGQTTSPIFLASMLSDPAFLGAFEHAKVHIADRDAISNEQKSNSPTLDDLVKEITPANKHREIDSGAAVGKEQQDAPAQFNMFDFLRQRTEEIEQRKEAEKKRSTETESTTDNPNLAPVRHNQRDFFVCDLVDYALKDDQASMEAPIFSLSTREDMKLWKWTSEDGKKSVEVAPGFYGRATQHDKDILIYCASQLTEAINKGLQPSKTVRFTAYDFLVATNRNAYGDDYERLRAALNRLRGMQITTNIITGKSRIAKGFGIIDSWEVIEKSPENDRMVAVEVTLSDWLYNSIQAHEVLTIHPDYFRLRKPLERRLYEIARKHVGKQGSWKINLATLHSKTGSTDVLRNFRGKLKEIIDADTIPQYRYQLGRDDVVTIYDRDPKQAIKGLI